jgi:hypothetical protein
MLKKLILSALIITLIQGCSKDSDIPDEFALDIALDLSKYTHTTYHEFPQPNSYEAFFNLNGTFSRLNSDHYPDVVPGYELFEYDDLDRLVAIMIYSPEGTFLNDITYEYNATNRLIKVTDNAAQSNPLNTIFTYNENEVTIFQEETGKSGSFIFDLDGKLIETTHDSGPSTVTRQEILYDNSNRVIDIKTFINSDQFSLTTFEYDDHANPFYEAYVENSLLYFTRELFDVDFRGYSNFFSPNNVTTSTTTGNDTRIDVRTFSYDNNGVPTNASTMRNGELRSIEVFEYY